MGNELTPAAPDRGQIYTASEMADLLVKSSGRKNMQWAEKMSYLGLGGRLLDRLASTDHGKMRIKEELIRGQHHFNLPGEYRAIHGVKVWEGSDVSHLEKRDRSYIDTYYPDLEDPSIWGFPIDYAKEYGTVFDVFGGYSVDVEIPSYLVDDFSAATRSDIRTIILAPPPDGDNYWIEIKGTRYSARLYDATDTNFWSEQNPTGLLWAAMAVLDAMYGNKERYAHFFSLAEMEARMTLYDQIEEEISDREMEMEG